MPEVDSHTSGVRRHYGGVVLIPTRRATSNSYDGVEPELATIHLQGNGSWQSRKHTNITNIVIVRYKSEEKLR